MLMVLGRQFIRAAVLAGATAGIALGGMAAAAAEGIVLRYSPWIGGPNHFLHADILQPLGKEIEEKTQGRVKLEFLPKVVGTVPSQFDVVRDGLADMVLIVEGYSPGRFVGAQMGELPFLSESIAVLAPSYWTAFKKHIEPMGDYEGTHVVVSVPSVSGNIFTVGKAIEKAADMKGLKLRVSGASTVRIAELLGVTPVQKPANEMFELLSTRVIDGTFGTGENVLLANKLGDVVPNMTIVPGGLYRSVISLLINEDAWNRISEEDRKLIDSLSGEVLARKIGVAYDRIEGDARKGYVDSGKTIRTLEGPAMTEMKSLLAPIEASWIEAATKAGMKDPAGALAEFKATIAANEKK